MAGSVLNFFHKLICLRENTHSLNSSGTTSRLSFYTIAILSVSMEGSTNCESKPNEIEPSSFRSILQSGSKFTKETPVAKKKNKRLSEAVFMTPGCNLNAWIPQTAPHLSQPYKRQRISFPDAVPDPWIATPIRTPNFDKYKPDLSGFTDDDRIDIGSRTSKHQTSTPCPTAPSKVKLTRSQTVQKKQKAKIVRLTWETREQIDCILIIYYIIY